MIGMNLRIVFTAIVVHCNRDDNVDDDEQSNTNDFSFIFEYSTQFVCYSFERMAQRDTKLGRGFDAHCSNIYNMVGGDAVY